jgi:hypothetical protein
MTDQERQLIQSVADRLRSSPPPQIDAEADELIRRTIGALPNAVYILTQAVLLQEMALRQAKSQNQPGFLGSGTWGRDGRLQQEPSGEGYGGAYRGNYRGSSYETGAPPPPSALRQEQPPQNQWVTQQPQSRTSSFLEGAAQTAAGMVAGQVAFSALSSLFGGHHHGGFLSGGGWDGDWGSGRGINETIINNNYFDESPSQGLHETSSEPDAFTSDVSDSFDDDSSFDGSDTFDV